MAKKKEIKDAVVSEEKKKKEEVIEEVKEVKEEKTSKNEKKKTKKDGFFKSIRKEMKQVVWPTGKDVLKSTIAVLIMCIFLALFFNGVELLMAFIKGWLS